MKLKLIILFLLTVNSFGLQAQDANSPYKKMHSRYAGKWMKTFTFMQTTEVYRNDSLKRKDTRYEAAEYPDKFRIDFALPDSGNAVIFKGDSS